LRLAGQESYRYLLSVSGGSANIVATMRDKRKSTRLETVIFYYLPLPAFRWCANIVPALLGGAQ